MSETKALLFDLGQVILNLDPTKVFAYWADHSGTDSELIAERWHTSDDYKAHEIGAIDFTNYCESLSAQLSITLSGHHWRKGWNALFVSTFDQVLAELHRLKSDFSIYAFTNTNPTHQQEWQRLYSKQLSVFSKIYVSSEIQMRKPDIEAYQRVSHDMGVRASEILFFDDVEENIFGAEQAGFQTQLVAHESTTLARLRQFR